MPTRRTPRLRPGQWPDARPRCGRCLLRAAFERALGVPGAVLEKWGVHCGIELCLRQIQKSIIGLGHHIGFAAQPDADVCRQVRPMAEQPRIDRFAIPF